MGNNFPKNGHAKNGHEGTRHGGGRSGRPPVGDPRTFRYLGPGHSNLDVRMMGRQRMADGLILRTWTFGNGFNDDRTVPSPVIEGIEGQVVEVTLSSMMPHTIHFHGLDVDQANDGVPSTSGYVGMQHGGGGGGGGGGMGMGFGRVDGYLSLGNQFTYRFTAPHAGTYAYHCHVDTVLHFEMGMYGTVIIRPPDGRADVAWKGGPTYDLEYVWNLHTFDSSWHSEMVSGPLTARHRPDYFMINGSDGAKASDDSTVAISGRPGDRVLIRSVNMGYQPALVRFGGLEFDIIASDGRPLPAPIRATERLVAPGERYDLLLRLPQRGVWEARADYLDVRLRKILGRALTSVTVR